MNNCNCNKSKNNIYRGTTPTIILKIDNDDFDMTDIVVCHVTIQNDNGRNKKVFDNPTIDVENKTISIELTQQDTLAYETGNINLQIKVKLQGGRVVASPILVTPMNKILEEAII